jgi:tetratricopeptide (TPR) repeat protein
VSDNKSIKDSFFSKTGLSQFIVGIISLLTAVSGIITNILSTRFSLLIGGTGIFIILFWILNTLIKAKKKSLEIFTDKHDKKKLESFKLGRIVIVLLYIPFLGYSIYPMLGLTQKCTRSGNTTDIIISNFNNSEGQDNFSFKLANSLKSKTEFNDSVEVLSTTRTIASGSNGSDTIRNEFNKLCSTKGLFVFGKWSIDDKIFDCNIYVENLSNLNYPKHLTGKKPKIIYLQSPDYISFSIADQAEMTANFILSIILLNMKDYEQSLNILLSFEKDLSNAKSKSFEFYRNFFIANNLLYQDKFSEAIVHYKKALNIDTSKEYCYYNLAIAYTALKQYSNAKKSLAKMKGGDKILLLEFITENNQHNSNILDKGPLNDSVEMYVNGQKAELKKNLSPPPQKPLAGIQKDSQGYYGVVDNGYILIPFEYTSIEEYTFKGQKFYIVEENGQFGSFKGNGQLYSVVNKESPQLMKTIIQMDLDKGNVSY